MSKIKCPKCETVFNVDEAEFAELLKQVRDGQFEKDLDERLELAEKEKLNAVQLAESKLQNTLEKELSKKDKELADLKAKNEKELNQSLANKDKELVEIKSKLESMNTEKTNAVQLAESKLKNTLQEEITKKDKELFELKVKKEQESAQTLKKIEQEMAELKVIKDKELAKKDMEMVKIKSKLEKVETEKELSVTKAVNKVEKERDELKNKLENQEKELKLKEANLKETHKNEIQLKDDTIDRLKDMKQKLSTKMLGETLEQHCEIEFNNLRHTAFQNSYFEKDNDTKKGSKGDYIFRESDDNVEIISIMFEMKNEADETANKKKNEDFLRELDKDRKEKNCEYAVLVSLLEADNDLYNNGIVDMSHKYPKMYVIRPQFFIPIISLLRNAGKKSLEYKNKLALVQNQELDISNFEEKIENFKKGFATNYKNASSQFETAIKEIDKSIKNLENTKTALLLSEKHLGSANKKTEDLTIKKLTYNNPTMKKLFSESKSKVKSNNL